MHATASQGTLLTATAVTRARLCRTVKGALATYYRALHDVASPERDAYRTALLEYLRS